MKVVAVYSTKGGVGKTTAAVNLAWQASEDFRVLLWDLDPQGAATYLLKVKPKLKGGVAQLVSGDTRVSRAIRATDFEHLDVLPADAGYSELEVIFDHAKKSNERVARVLHSVADDYDVVILDCPPGSSRVAENAIWSADLVVVPLVPSPLSLRSLQQVSDVVAASAEPPGILGFLSMVDRRKTTHRDAMIALPKENSGVANIFVPSTVVIERMGSERAPVGVYAPNTEAALSFSELWVRVQSLIKAKRHKKRR